MRYSYYILIAVCFIGNAKSLPCDSPPPAVANFDRDRFLGTWYVLEASGGFDPDMMCVREVFTTGTIMNVEYKFNASNEEYSFLGVITDDGTPNDGDLELEMTDIRNFVVMDTDYDRFVVLYNCIECDQESCEMIEIATKRLPPDSYDAAIALAHPVVTSNTDFDPTEFIKLNHTGCNYPTKFELFKQKIMGMFNKGGTGARNSPVTGTRNGSRTGTRNGLRTGTRNGSENRQPGRFTNFLMQRH